MDHDSGSEMLGRMSIEKQYHGDLEGTAKGQMLTGGTPIKNSAGYVAIEHVTGTLKGRKGSFILQHTGVMNRGSPSLASTIVPDSRAGQLEGIGEVRGTIVAADSSAAAVPRPAIAVRGKSDGKLVTGAYGAEDGTFRIQGLRPGTYYLRVSGIGFTPLNTPEFTIDPASPTANVGSIKLSRISVTLQAVQITGEKPTVAIEPDRNTYRAKDVAPAASNASDVLQATPSVEVDADGKVSLRGNENVAIQINGRPTPIKGTQLAAYLKQIPANIVERIEVVPNPSAKYDPEGMAGIINIVLKTTVDLGLSAGLNTGFATPSRFNTGGNVGYQSGPVTLFGTYGFNADDRAITGLNDRSRFTPTGAPQDYQNQDIDGATRNGGHNFTRNIH